MIDIGSAGCNSDGGVLSHSQFGQALERNEIGVPAPDLLPNTTDTRCPYLFTADDAFPQDLDDEAIQRLIPFREQQNFQLPAILSKTYN